MLQPTFISTDLPFGQLRVRQLTQNTALKGSDAGQVFSNEGAIAAREHTLPPAVKGLCYTFHVKDAFSMVIRARAGSTIRLNTTVSALAGSASAAITGASIKIIAINDTEWVALYSTGIWTIT